MPIHAAPNSPSRTADPDAEGPLTLLVGYDGSDEARAAFTNAVERAGPEDRIFVLHAYDPVSTWLGTPYYQQALDESIDEGRRVFQDLLEQAAASPAEVVFELHEGQPAEVISRIAALREVDQIIVGSRGHGRLRAAIGSVSRALLRSADRPVLVVPRKAADDA